MAIIIFLFFIEFLFICKVFRDVAQPGSAHVWGAWGRKFESCHPDLMKASLLERFFYFLILICPTIIFPNPRSLIHLTVV
jgi:hypothetical protein